MRIVFCLLALALVTACDDGARKASVAAADSAVSGEAAPPVESVPGVKACDLMTAEDARRITAVELQTGVTTNDYMGSSQCRFDRADGSRTGIMISLHTHGDIENYRKVPGSTQVDGLGDAAVWNPQTNQLAVRSGDAVFSISFLFAPAQRAWAVELARAALPKLEAAKEQS
jgi:hypothetical protein